MKQTFDFPHLLQAVLILMTTEKRGGGQMEKRKFYLKKLHLTKGKIK